jgi:hypothetical protein
MAPSGRNMYGTSVPGVVYMETAMKRYEVGVTSAWFNRGVLKYAAFVKVIILENVDFIETVFSFCLSGSD